MDKAASNGNLPASSQDFLQGGQEQTRFSLERRVAKGNTGEVHEGILHESDGTSRRVAVKVLADNPDDEPGRLRHFVERLNGVKLPHVELPQEFIPSSAGRVLIYEWLDGLSLVEVQRRLKRLGRPMPTALTLEIVSQALEGLHAIHALNPAVLHRNIKPSNLFIQRDGTVKLLDAGVFSPLLHANSRARGLAVVNVLPYLAPEQLAEPPKLSPGTDLYGLGVVAYELIAGRPLFDGSAARRELEIRVGFSVQDKVRALEAILPGISGVLGRAVALTPAERYSTAADMRTAVLALKGDGQQPELEALMQELMVMPERSAAVAGLKSGETTTRIAEPALASGGALRSTFEAPTVKRQVEPMPARMLMEQRQRSERTLKLGVALASLVLALGTLWWVDRGRAPEPRSPASSERALKQASSSPKPASEPLPDEVSASKH